MGSDEQTSVYKEWEAEFADYLGASPHAPPPEMSEAICCAVRKDLHPSPWLVFARVTLVVLASSVLSLAVCPQFGLWGRHHSGLKEVFMSWLGMYGCEIACGAFFTILGVGLAIIVLRPEEIRVMRQTAFLQASALSSLFLVGLVCAGPEAFSFAMLLWFIGATVGGLATLEIGFRFRFWKFAALGA